MADLNKIVEDLFPTVHEAAGRDGWREMGCFLFSCSGYAALAAGGGDAAAEEKRI